MIKNISRAIFNSFIWPKWLDYVTQADSPKVWERSFRKTSVTTSSLSIDTAILLSKQPSIIRLMLNTFKADRSVPSAEDFAVSIAVEVKDSFEEYDIDVCQIRNFASGVRRNWLDSINSNPIYKNQFKEIRGTHPAEYLSEFASCTPDFDVVLSTDIKLWQAFYGSFETFDATETVKVWLPDSKGIVDYSVENHTVSVSLNASRGADLGFVRIGYDYSLEGKDGEQDWLKLAFRKNVHALESMCFNKLIGGRGSANCIWAK